MPLILRYKDVLERVNFSKSTINRREKKGMFPEKQRWGNSVFWFDYQIKDFLKNPSKYSGGKN